MPTGAHEQTINTALGEVLHQLGREWTLRSEHVGRIFEEGGRPDILVEKKDGWPIVIEAEVANHQQAEIEATGVAPTNDLESALVATLQPGNYTAQLRGSGGTTGIGVVELYALP